LAAAYGDTLNPYGTKTANYVLAGPTTGAAAVPTFRALVANDIPSLSYVTSVSFTGGIITVANPTTTPALTVAGTSGGIPYFSSGTTWASSAALTQYGVVYGGGAGATPVATAAGTTGQVLTATTGAHLLGLRQQLAARSPACRLFLPMALLALWQPLQLPPQLP